MLSFIKDDDDIPLSSDTLGVSCESDTSGLETNKLISMITIERTQYLKDRLKSLITSYIDVFSTTISSQPMKVSPCTLQLMKRNCYVLKALKHHDFYFLRKRKL